MECKNCEEWRDYARKLERELTLANKHLQEKTDGINSLQNEVDELKSRLGRGYDSWLETREGV